MSKSGSDIENLSSMIGQGERLDYRCQVFVIESNMCIGTHQFQVLNGQTVDPNKFQQL